MSPETVTSMAQKRVRRQKQIIAVGSILLLAILGFELPKLLGGGGSNAVTAVTTVSPGAVGVPPAVALGRLPATDRVVIQRDSNQLISFGLFQSKDPFVQQLSTTPSAPSPAAAPAPAPTPTTATAAPASPSTGLSPAPAIPATTPGASAPTGAPGAPVAQGTTPGTTTPAAPAAAPTQALLSTNGVCEQVAVNGTFPANENIFRLVSIARNGKSVEVGVVGGSFDSGQSTATLKLGEKLTLVNTADGTRYVVELESKCSVVAQPGSSTSPQTPTTPVAPAPAPSATPTTTTTPIVTDFLDTTVPTG